MLGYTNLVLNSPSIINHVICIPGPYLVKRNVLEIRITLAEFKAKLVVEPRDYGTQRLSKPLAIHRGKYTKSSHYYNFIAFRQRYILCNISYTIDKFPVFQTSGLAI